MTGVPALLIIVAVLGLLALLIAGLGAVFAFLWNAVMPSLVGAQTIDTPVGMGAVLLLWLVSTFFRR